MSHNALRRRILQPVELPPAAGGPFRIAPGHEVWISRDEEGIARSISDRLRASGVVVRIVDGCQPPAEHTRVGGLVILAPSDSSAPGRLLSDASILFVKQAFQLAQSVGADLCGASQAGGAALVTVSRMDGAFGLIGGEFDPAGGGLAGLVKTAAHEWPGVRCRALDVAATWRDADAIADTIVRELGQPRPMEVGLDRGIQRGLALVDEPAVPGLLDLAAGDVVVITGGARGVTAEAAVALAKAARPALVLLGRSLLPDAEPDWLANIEAEADIKRAIMRHEFGSNGQPKPAEVEKRYRRRMADREILHNLARMRQHAAGVTYCAVDVRDATSVRRVLGEITSTLGPIRAIVHGAGVLEDRRITDKTRAQFDAVFDTKVAGLTGLLDAVETRHLRHLVLFSSVSGRFGRQGQADYAMANEVLNKAAQRFARQNPGVHVASINWGPWDGGMVTPALKREFERQRIPLIPVDAGVRAFISEMACTQGCVEVVLGDGMDETRPATDDVHDAIVAQPGARVRLAERGVFERVLDLSDHPFLESHVVGGHAVLPVAVMLEWLAEAALQIEPDLRLIGVDDLRVYRGVTLLKGSYAIRIAPEPSACPSTLQPAPCDADQVCVHAALTGTSGHDAHPHARATIILARRHAAAPAARPIPLPDRPPLSHDLSDPYRDILFHGPHFHAIRLIESADERGVVARLRSAPSPQSWMSNPPRDAWLTDPLIVDGALQMGIIWTHHVMNAVALPTFIQHYRQYCAAFPADGVTAVMRCRREGEHKAVADVQLVDARQQVVARLEGVEWIVDASLAGAYRRRRLEEAVARS